MPETTWLLLDANNTARRAQHTTGHLADGTVYGFLRQVVALRRQFPGARFVFCWDYGLWKRLKLFGGYKADRRQKRLLPTDEAEAAFNEQCRQLKCDHLPALGFANVFRVRGYEADDVIASAAGTLLGRGPVVIVSDDRDLYQLLTYPNVSIWKPSQKALFTFDTFAGEFPGLHPAQWAQVKALAGCPSDGIPGIKGVGERTAAQFLTGKLKDGPRHQAILDGEALWKRNLKLTRLPFPGCPTFEIKGDAVTAEKWQSLAGRLGLKGLGWPDKSTSAVGGLF